MIADPLLEVENLRTTFETKRGTLPAVDGVSFGVGRGEVVGLVGESGSGKSVTALSILRLLEDNASVTADAVRYDGEDLLDKSEPEMQRIRGGEISVIFQDPASSLNPAMTVGEQIAEVVRHHGDTGEATGLASELRRKYLTGTDHSSASWRRAVELLDVVGLSDPETRATQYPHQLSGGMLQRVMIAQALAGEPSLIIADEPTTALDVSIEAQILAELRRLSEDFGVSVLLITHDLAVVRETCSRVAVMYAGELMERAPTEPMFSAPKHPYTQGLLASIPRLTDDREWLDTIDGSVPDPLNKPAGCPFRTRCGEVFDQCDDPLVGHRVDTQHTVFCHLYDEATGDVEPTGPPDHGVPDGRVDR
jgi:peptide/nickel transport system ATP-binding protein